MIDNQAVAFPVYHWCMMTSLSVDGILLLRYMNWSGNLLGLPFNLEMVSSSAKYMNSISSFFM